MYVAPNPEWEKEDAGEREQLLAYVKKELLSLTGKTVVERDCSRPNDRALTDFWHRGERWVYGIHLEPRDHFSEPPTGLDIKYDGGITIMIDNNPPHRSYIIPPGERNKWLNPLGVISSGAASACTLGL